MIDKCVVGLDDHVFIDQTSIPVENCRTIRINVPLARDLCSKASAMSKVITFDGLHLSYDFVTWSDPRIDVQKMVFTLAGFDVNDTRWSSRFAHVSLNCECWIEDRTRPGWRLATVSTRTGISVSPMHLRPVFELADQWCFRTPDPKVVGILPNWHVRLWLEGFEFKEGESAIVVHTTNMEVIGAAVAENEQ